MITELREYFVDRITTAVGDLAIVTTQGDLTTVGDAREAKVRVKVLPREAPSLDTTQSLKQMAGIISCDVFSPRIDGYADAEAISQAIINEFTGFANIGPVATDFGQINVLNAWVESIVEEGQAYLRSPTFIRWTLLYN